MTAPCATATLAPDAPSIARPRNNTHNAPAAPVMMLPIAVPTNDKMMTGLRPIRSDKRPINGAHTICAKENVANSRPTSKPLAPYLSA